VRTKLSAEDVDDAPTFADDADAFDDRYANHTTAMVNWDDIGSWTAESEYDSPDISSVIQEIVNRAGWASGNDLVLFWEDFDGRSSKALNVWRSAHSYDGDTTKAPLLTIDYKAAVPYYQTITDIIGMVDTTPAPKGAFKQAVTEPLGLLDAVPAPIASLKLSTGDILGMRDTIKAPGRVELPITDILGMVDAATRRGDFKELAVDRLGLVDTTATKAAFKMSVEDILGLLERQIPKWDAHITVSDILGMVDSAARAKGYPITITDIIGLKDRILRRKHLGWLRDVIDHHIYGGADVE